MIDAFSAALGTALTEFVTDVTAGIGANVPTVLTITLGLVGMFLLVRVILKLIGSR